MGDYLRLLTVNDRDVPLATLQRALAAARKAAGKGGRQAAPPVPQCAAG